MYSILIVDDREIFRRQFKRFSIFKNNSEFEIKYEAQNGEEALEILQNNDVDLTITDIRMPIMDGLQLLEEIKSRNLCRCVVLLSEYADFSYARQGIVLGAFDYIVKPIDEEKLSELLDRTKIFLSGNAGDSFTVSRAQAEKAAQLIMSNDNYAEKMCGDIADSIIKARDNRLAVIDTLNSFLNMLREEIFLKREYLASLINGDEVFSFDYAEEDDICGKFTERIRVISKEVNKFNVNTKNEIVRSVCNCILNNVGKNISLQRMSELHFVNKAYLSHLFSQEVGMSFVDYVNKVKIEYAKCRLAAADVKIYEIASELEYSNTEYFSKVFKQYTGYTPSAYRQEFGKV
ncbi:MAG: response regulator [Oscillospiraceae bacterium]|nr:response regulator [Oscillospiraceae bacterium]